MTVSVVATIVNDSIQLKGTGNTLHEACRIITDKAYVLADLDPCYPDPKPFCLPLGAGYIYFTDHTTSKAALREQEGTIEHMMSWASGETLHTYVHTEPLEPTVENTLDYVRYALGGCESFSISTL